MSAILQNLADLELVYFNGRGLAETSRILLALANQPYTDKRYPLKVIDWKSHKFERKEFAEDKASGKLIKSLGKVPYLKTQDTVICQSKSIERYLSRKFGFMGINEEESAQIDAFCEHIRDIKASYQIPRKLAAGVEKTEVLEEFFKITLPTKLKDIENSLEISDYVVGDKISLADVTLFGLVEFFDNKEGILSALPDRLNVIYEKIAKNPIVKNWVENRPETPF